MTIGCRVKHTSQLGALAYDAHLGYLDAACKSYSLVALSRFNVITPGIKINYYAVLGGGGGTLSVGILDRCVRSTIYHPVGLSKRFQYVRLRVCGCREVGILRACSDI